MDMTSPCGEGWSGWITGIQDRLLRPIRPQRNDATDEMIQLLGTPKKETV